MKKIIQIEPWIDELELEELKKVVNSTFVTEWNLNKEFEDITALYTKSKYAITICNGTCALFCCLKALNIGEGDEVIVPNLTFIATATAVILTGAKVRLVDVNPTTGCIDPLNFLAAINTKTKAVIPVHLYGISCDMDEINDIAKKKNIQVIEDAAQGVGVKYKGKHVGTFGELGVLSYYGNKTITTGEGGMILTNNYELSKKVYMIKNHGREKKGTFKHEIIGWNFSFTEMQAALGISQMKKLDQIISIKKKIFNFYKENISNEKLYMRPVPKTTTSPVHWFSNIHCSNAEKLEIYLKENNVPTRRLFFPLNKQPCFKNNNHVINLHQSFPGTEFAYKTILSLPSSILLDIEQKEFIVNVINKY